MAATMARPVPAAHPAAARAAAGGAQDDEQGDIRAGLKDAGESLPGALNDAIERMADDVLLPLAGRTLRSNLGDARTVGGLELVGAGLAFSCAMPELTSVTNAWASS